MEKGELKDFLLQRGDTKPQDKEVEFQSCVNLILDGSNGLTNYEMLQLFGLYKQVTEGNLNEPRPVASGNSVAAAKW